MQIWWQLTEFGDSTVLLPMALVIALWLLVQPVSRRAGWLWLAAVVTGIGLVIVSKLLYMAWGIHPLGLDFIGLSGHSTMAFLFWPVVGAFVLGSLGSGARWIGMIAGIFLAAVVASSRLVLQAHTPSEVVLGSLWGALLAASFLWLTRDRIQALPRHGWIALLVLVPPLLLTPRLSFPSSHVLAWVAMRLSGHASVYTRTDLEFVSSIWSERRSVKSLSILTFPTPERAKKRSTRSQALQRSHGVRV